MTEPQQVFERALRLVRDRDLHSHVGLSVEAGTLGLPFTRLGVAFAAGVVCGVQVFAATVLLPVGDPRLPPAPMPGQRF